MVAREAWLNVVRGDRRNVARKDGRNVGRKDWSRNYRFLFPFSDLEKLKISSSVLNPVLVGKNIAVQVHRDGVNELVSGGLDHLVRLAGGQGGRRQVDEPTDPPCSSSEYLARMAGSETWE